MEMTRKALQEICKEQKLYRTPSLNDKLYLNFKGFVSIGKDLEDYVNVRALFLEGNAISTLEGLPPLKELRCLFVQNNDLSEVSGLEEISNLDTLNISNNRIDKLSNLSCCTLLRTLICTNNKLDTVESIAHLAELTGLQTLDLQNNDISDPAALEVIKQIPELKCLYLKGNPIVSNTKNYRKTVVSSMPCLTYLDERPVFEEERRLTMAWFRGGVEAEREERRRIREEDEARKRANFEAMQQIRREGWRRRREKLGLPPGDTDPALDDLSDEEYVFVEDPPELVAARERLAQYTARQDEQEPPELSEARQKLVNTGVSVLTGSSPQAEDDTSAYLDSVKRSQLDLDQQGKGGQVQAMDPSDPAMPALERVGDVDDELNGLD